MISAFIKHIFNIWLLNIENHMICKVWFLYNSKSILVNTISYQLLKWPFDYNWVFVLGIGKYRTSKNDKFEVSDHSGIFLLWTYCFIYRNYTQMNTPLNYYCVNRRSISWYRKQERPYWSNIWRKLFWLLCFHKEMKSNTLK